LSFRFSSDVETKLVAVTIPEKEALPPTVKSPEVFQDGPLGDNFCGVTEPSSTVLIGTAGPNEIPEKLRPFTGGVEKIILDPEIV
jgi:hypothetical protein